MEWNAVNGMLNGMTPRDGSRAEMTPRDWPRAAMVPPERFPLPQS